MQTSGGDLLLNLVHYQVGHQGDREAIPSIEKVYPFHDALCRVRTPEPRRVVLEPHGEELSFTYTEGYATFTVPRTQYMSIVRITR